MFKKKSSTLPRPTPPGPKHMLEDLSNVDQDDIIFTLMRNNTSSERIADSFNSEDDDMEREPTELENSNRIEAMYEKVKSFVGENNDLHIIMKELQQKHEALQLRDLELKKMAEDIRNQAVDALK